MTQTSFELPMRANITLTPRQLALAMASVAVGGAAGTLLRDLLERLQSIPPEFPSGWSAFAPLSNWPNPYAAIDWTNQIPWILLAINVVGVYAATRLLRGPLHQRDPNNLTRLVLITGLLGGFTSYSSLFAALGAIWHLSIGGSILTGAGAILSGVIAAMLGLGRVRR
jgi:fluoride ion exporter CrcB/FEX